MLLITTGSSVLSQIHKWALSVPDILVTPWTNWLLWAEHAIFQTVAGFTHRHSQHRQNICTEFLQTSRTHVLYLHFYTSQHHKNLIVSYKACWLSTTTKTAQTVVSLQRSTHTLLLSSIHPPIFSFQLLLPGICKKAFLRSLCLAIRFLCPEYYYHIWSVGNVLTVVVVVSGMQLWDCGAPYVDIILHRGQFWAKSAASSSVRWWCFESCWKVLSHMMRDNLVVFSSPLEGD